MGRTILYDRHTEHGHQLDHGWTRSPLGLLVPPRQRRRYDRPVAVDLFAGAGGFGMGMHAAGYHVAAASEVWVTAAITYMSNLARPGVRIHCDTADRYDELERELTRMYRLDDKSRRRHHGLVTGREDWDRLGPIPAAGSGWIAGQPPDHPGCEHFFLYDVRNLTGQLILEALGLEVGEVAVVTGGPPCQGFSAAGRRDVMDPRNSLVFEYARLICEIQPKTFVMENVPGLLSMTTPEGIPVLDAFCMAVQDGGYGEYDALRKALGVAEGAARAGIRQSRKAEKKRKARRAAEPEPAAPSGEEQLDLFAAVGRG